MRGAALLVLILGCHTVPPASAERVAPVADAAAEPAPVADVAPVRDVPVASPARTQAEHVEVTILSTTKKGKGIGEWGFAALIEVDGKRILFDAGRGRDTVLRNAHGLQLDLRTVDDVVLSHHHDDHVGGLLRLRDSVAQRRPEALATVHVGQGMFAERRLSKDGRNINGMLAIRTAYEKRGGHFVVHDTPAELAPGVWITGPVPRRYDERNWSGKRWIEVDGKWVEDSLPESQALVIDTADGLVVVAGCGHAGIVNVLTYARETIRDAPIHAAIGGFHLHKADQPHLRWTADQLGPLQLQELLGAHCTGDRPVQRFAEWLAIPTSVAAVGTTYAGP